MADEAIKRLIELGINATPAVQELEKLRAETKKQTTSLDDLSAKLSKFGDTIKLAAGLKFAWEMTQMVVGGIHDIIKGLDDLNDKAEGLGIGVEKLQELEHAASMSGLPVEKLHQGLATLQDKLSDVDTSTDSAAKILRSFGVTAKDDLGVVLDKVADNFAKVENGTTKTAYAMELMGKKIGVSWVPLLNEGSSGLKDLAKEAHNVGAVLSEETIKEAALFSDNLDRLGKNLASVGRGIVKELLPSLVALSNQLVQNIRDFGIWSGVLQTIAEKMGGTAVENFNKELKDLERTQAGIRDRLAEIDASKDVFIRNSVAADSLRKSLEQNEARLKLLRDGLKGMAAAAADVKRATEEQGKLPPKPESGAGKVAKTAKEAKEAREGLDEVAKALFKIGDEAAALDRVPLIIAAITDNLEKMAEAGLEGTTEFRLLKEKLLELEATTDPIARVTLELEKMQKVEEENAAIRQEALTRLQLELINEEQYAKVVQAHGGKMAEETEKTTEHIKTLSESLGEMSAKFAVDFIDQIIDDMGRAETSFGDMVETFLKQIAKLLVSQQLQQLLKLFEGMGTASGSTAGRWFESLRTSAQGNAWSARGVEAMASGGILSRPTFFANGGKLAVAGESGPEAVVPLQRTAGGDLGVGASPVQVNVYNNAGAEVTTATRDNEDGTRQIDVYIERKVKEMMGNGTMDRTMRNSFGLSRQPTIG